MVAGQRRADRLAFGHSGQRGGERDTAPLLHPYAVARAHSEHGAAAGEFVEPPTSIAVSRGWWVQGLTTPMPTRTREVAAATAPATAKAPRSK